MQYMAMVYDDSFVQDYVRNSAEYFDTLDEAKECAINATKEFIDDGIDYLMVDIFRAFGIGTDQWCIIGEVTYTLDCDEPYKSIEFEECFC